MAKIGPGQTVFSSGVLNPPHYLFVEAGGALKAANGATNNAEIHLYGSTSLGETGGYGLVLASATVFNGAGAGILVSGGGGINANPSGPGGTLVVGGTLYNLGGIMLDQGAYSGGAPFLSIAAGGSLTNEGSLYLFGAEGSSSLPGFNIAGASAVIAGQLTNTGKLAIDGGQLGMGYSGGGAQVLIKGPSYNYTGIINLGTIAINGAYGSVPLGVTAPQSGIGGTLTVDAGGLVNDGKIIIGAATNDRYGYGAAGGLLQTVGTGHVLNAGTIFVDGQTTGKTGPAPGGTLSIDGKAFRDTGTLNVGGASVRLGSGGVLNVASAMQINGTVNVQSGSSGGYGGTAALASTVLIGVGPPAGYLQVYGNASAAITGDTVIGPSGHININPDGATFGGVTITASGTLFDNGNISGTGTLINNGHIYCSGVILQDVFGQQAIGELVNNGTVNVSGHDVTAYANITGNGLIMITGGGFLGGGVDAASAIFGAGQTVQFAATPGLTETLSLDKMADFHATLANINDTTHIDDFSGIYITGAASSGNQLTVSTISGAVYNLKLAAPLPSGTQVKFTGQMISFVLPGGALPFNRAADSGFGASLSGLLGGHLTP